MCDDTPIITSAVGGQRSIPPPAQEDTDWTTRARVTAGASAMAQRALLAAVASAAAAESGALDRTGIHPHSSASSNNDDKSITNRPACFRVRAASVFRNFP